MATIQPVSVPSNITTVRNERWAALLAGDNGAATPFAQYSDRSVQVTGVFGAGGSLVVEGSNDGGVTWATLTDPQGAALTFTTPGLKQVAEIAGLLRPRVSGGDGTTSINVNLCMRTA